MAGRPKRRQAKTKAEQSARAKAIRDRYLKEAEQEVAKRKGTEKYIRRIENLKREDVGNSLVTCRRGIIGKAHSVPCGSKFPHIEQWPGLIALPVAEN